MSAVDTCDHDRLADSCERCAWLAARDRGAPLGGPEPGTATQPPQAERIVPAADVDRPGVPVAPDAPAVAARIVRRPQRRPFQADADEDTDPTGDASTGD